DVRPTPDRHEHVAGEPHVEHLLHHDALDEVEDLATLLLDRPHPGEVDGKSRELQLDGGPETGLQPPDVLLVGRNRQQLRDAWALHGSSSRYCLRSVLTFTCGHMISWSGLPNCGRNSMFVCCEYCSRWTCWGFA